ncbi:hypothetical protein BB558_002866 [Smittium angustum]|uniref:CBS domain-containing protein n=1 Tax=Smittium angustum TaxID=133377 RepID=A0A2U1J7H9_SMIAN|nr:hypothetical protein BB558_002866 [Smittium angustum]
MNKTGLVKNLKPDPAHTIKTSTNIIIASQLMAAKKVDVMLVIDDEERLIGIFTTKDIAFRCVAAQKNPNLTKVLDVATPNPLCITLDTLGIDALNTMVQKSFRHLPVCNDEGDVVGMLDIIKCMYEGMEKLDKTLMSTTNMYKALKGLEKEFNMQPKQMERYLAEIKNILHCPKVETLTDTSNLVIVNTEEKVFNVTQQMQAKNTTAALVIDSASKLVGILTTKDVVLRVIAAGLDPLQCSAQRAMTPHPDTISSETLIIDALKQMYKKKYLNLPVINKQGGIEGVVNVIELSKTTLEIINQSQNNAKSASQNNQNSIPNNPNESNQQPDFAQNTLSGPLWSLFFNNNNSFSDIQSNSNRSRHSGLGSDLKSGIIDTSRFSDEVFPDESASMIYNQGNVHTNPYNNFNTKNQHQNANPFQKQGSKINNSSEVSNQKSGFQQTNHITQSQHPSQSTVLSNSNVNHSSVQSNSMTSWKTENREKFSFKFKSPRGKLHRFTSSANDFKELKANVAERLKLDGIDDSSKLLEEFGIEYLDADDDFIQLKNNFDLMDSVSLAVTTKHSFVTIQISDISIVDNSTTKVPDKSADPLETTPRSAVAISVVWLMASKKS